LATGNHEEMKRDTAIGRQKQLFHVLVVDDEFLIRNMVRKALAHLGVTVDVAENGLEAQQKIIAGNYNLVITDINMPEMNGADLLRWIWENHPNIEGIVMTGYDLDKAITTELSAWVTDYLIKPFPLAKLLDAVKRSMDRLEGREGRNLEKNGGQSVQE
ncbi:MAG: response regulator, partial [Deltaproteobacteria bacterium]